MQSVFEQLVVYNLTYFCAKPTSFHLLHCLLQVVLSVCFAYSLHLCSLFTIYNKLNKWSEQEEMGAICKENCKYIVYKEIGTKRRLGRNKLGYKPIIIHTLSVLLLHGVD